MASNDPAFEEKAAAIIALYMDRAASSAFCVAIVWEDNTKPNPMVFTKLIGQIKQAWEKAPQGSYQEESALMRLLITVVVAARFLSPANLKDVSGAAAWQRNFMDVYVTGWLACLVVFLILPGQPATWQGWLAAYLLAEVIHYRFYFVLIKGWNEPWTEGKLRRSLVLALVNVIQIVVAFAIVFRSFGHIGPPGTRAEDAIPLDPVEAVYFSTITFGTVGFGDLIPLDSGSQILVMTEVAAGMLTLVLLIPLVLAGLAGKLHQADADSGGSGGRLG